MHLPTFCAFCEFIERLSADVVFRQQFWGVAPLKSQLARALGGYPVSADAESVSLASLKVRWHQVEAPSRFGLCLRMITTLTRPAFVARETPHTSLSKCGGRLCPDHAPGPPDERQEAAACTAASQLPMTQGQSALR